MKWTNRGHELDDLGIEYAKIANLYIWGAGKGGKECIDFLRWLKVDNNFVIKYVDSNCEKQGTEYCGINVIAPEDLFAEYNDNSVIVSTIGEVSSLLAKKNMRYFNWVHEHTGNKNFVQNFLCVWFLYKCGKLLSHWTSFNITLKCNLNCKGCLNHNEYIHNVYDIASEKYKEHFSVLFSKFDYLYSFHLCGGEPQLYKELPQLLRYLNENYRDRIFDFFMITNGTIVPSDEVIAALKESRCRIIVDDYSENASLCAKRLPLVLKKLKEYDISYVRNKPSSWFDLDFDNTDNSALNEDEMIKWRDSCNTFLNYVADCRIYSCCFEQYAMVAGVVEEAEYIDIRSTSKKELLEYRLGYTPKGYVNFCRRCRGIGANMKTMPPAVQVPKKE